MRRLAIWLALVVILAAGWFVWSGMAKPGDRASTLERDAPAIASAPGAAAQREDPAVVLRRRLAFVEDESESVRAAMARARAQLAASRGPGPDWWGRPLHAIFDELRAAAEGGDIAAAYALGSRSASCQEALVDTSSAQLLVEYEEEEASERERGDDEPTRLGRARNSGRQYLQRLDHYESCRAVGDARLAEGRQWLRTAAAAGNQSARSTFVRDFHTRYGSDRRAAAIADIEQARRDRGLARDWLQQGLQAGEEWALRQYHDAYVGSPLYAPDAVRAATYSYVIELVQSRRRGEFDALWSNGPYRGTWLTPAQWDAAADEGRAIFDAFYRDKPVWLNGAPPADLIERVRKRRAALRAAPGA